MSFPLWAPCMIMSEYSCSWVLLKCFAVFIADCIAIPTVYCATTNHLCALVLSDYRCDMCHEAAAKKMDDMLKKSFIMSLNLCTGKFCSKPRKELVVLSKNLLIVNQRCSA